MSRVLRSAMAPILALAAAAAVSAVLLSATGNSVTAAAHAFVEGAFGNSRQTASTLNKMVPICLTAAGWIVAFRTRRINVGLEGQMIGGGICAAWVGIYLDAPPPLHLALAVSAGFIGGAFLAWIAAWMWARANANEIITTLMLNLIMVQVLSWLIRGPMQDKESGFARSLSVAEDAQWPELISSSALHTDVLLVGVVLVGTWLLLTRSTAGMRMKVVGTNPTMAFHMKISPTRVSVVALVLSGALAGFAGSSRVLAGEVTTISDNFTGNFGFDGIVVALLARNTVPGVLPAALLVAALRQSGGALQSQAGIASEIVLIMQGLIIVLVAASGFIEKRWRASMSQAAESRHAGDALGAAPGAVQ